MTYGKRAVQPDRDYRTYHLDPLPGFEAHQMAKMSRRDLAAMPISPFVNNTKELFVSGETIFTRRSMRQDLAKIPNLTLHWSDPRQKSARVRAGSTMPSCRLEKQYPFVHFDRNAPRGVRSSMCAVSNPPNRPLGHAQLQLINQQPEKFRELQGYRARFLIGSNPS